MKEFILFYFFIVSVLLCQTKNTTDYNEGMDALTKGDSASAEILFLKSADIYKDAASFYRLGQLYSIKKTLSSGKKAERFFGEAAKREKGNVDYRRDYAKQLAANKDSDALEEFENILKDFPKLTEARVWLADYYSAQAGNVSSLLQKSEAANLSGQQVKGLVNFKKAEELFAGVLTAEPENKEALWGMAELYMKAKNYDKSSMLLRKYCSITDTSKNAFLLLGIIENAKREWNAAKDSFEKAFSLMRREERDDFVYNSAVDLLKSRFVIDEHFDRKTEIEELIKRFWDAFSFNSDDGVYSRELEHYARTAFANIYLAESSQKVYGRTTAKGEAYIRYGVPDSVFSSVNKNTRNNTQVWNYSDFYLEFTSKKGGSIHSDQLFFDWKKGSEFQRYSPYRIKEKTLYDFYTFEPAENNTNGEMETYFVFNYPDFGGSVRYKLLVYDNELLRLAENGGWISKPNAPAGVGCIHAILPPARGVLTVNLDNGADSGTFVSADYDNREIDEKPRISDIIFVSQIDSSRLIPGAIKRGRFSIVPSINKTFDKNSPLIVYFEVDGLTKDMDNLSRYEQTISIEKKNDDDEGLIEKIADFLSKETGQITNSIPKRGDKGRQTIYLSQDIKKLKAGEYNVIVKVKDTLSGRETEKRSEIKITGS